MTSSKSRTFNSLDTSDLTSSGRYSPSPIRDNDVPVSGEALRLVSVNRPATFVIDTSFNGQRPADLSDVVVDITGKFHSRPQELSPNLIRQYSAFSDLIFTNILLLTLTILI